jgi:hypothetical protein
MFPRSPKPMNLRTTPNDIVRLRSKPEKQNGGYQTGSTCISRSIIDRSEIRNVISKFSMSARPINSSPTPADIVRHWKRKMAAAKPEVLICCFPVSFDVGGYQFGVHRSGRHRKHTNNILNFVSVYDRP